MGYLSDKGKATSGCEPEVICGGREETGLSAAKEEEMSCGSMKEREEIFEMSRGRGKASGEERGIIRLIGERIETFLGREI